MWAAAGEADAGEAVWAAAGEADGGAKVAEGAADVEAVGAGNVGAASESTGTTAARWLDKERHDPPPVEGTQAGGPADQSAT